MDRTPLHALRASEVYAALETAPSGLASAEAASRLSLFGPNRLTEIPAPPIWRSLLSHLAHPLAVLLWVAGLLAFVSRQPALGIAVWIVVVVNGLFSFWQEYRAQRAMEALGRLLPGHARVVRDGGEVEVLSSETVPGDVLVLAEGDSIPADARVVEAFGLRTNNAVLTGEAMPAQKSQDASLSDGLSELERPNLVFAGTSVVSGTGRAVVCATGMLTQFGRIARLTQQVSEPPSPLQQETRRLTRRITVIAVAAGAIVFAVSLLQLGLPVFESFLLAIGILVAVVPEGLTPIITLTLASAGQRLARHGVLVKKLAVIETLGTISMVCTDKSGTLTQNQMTIREVWVGGRLLAVSGTGYDPAGRLIPGEKREAHPDDLAGLLRVASLCNNARLIPPSSDRPQWSCLGDQTEAALRVLAIKGGMDQEKIRQRFPRVHEFPFDARRKRMSTFHLAEGKGLACIKGAPREVLQLCDHILLDGENRPLDETTRAAILEANDGFARRALRVLALAQRELPGRISGLAPDQVERELTFLGLVAMMDPPRADVAGAIESFHAAGIRMVMITGDYGLTAESVARRIGMLRTARPAILTGAEIDAMSDVELSAIISRQEVIFARMAPDHKLRLVDCMQRLGEVVAVVGDGVNDAPALRKADVGIAMGIVGTDVAKEASDVVLTDDDFTDIAMAVHEGRAVYDNLRRFVTYIFASNVPEILPFILTALLGIPLALRAHHILTIDLGTDLLPALALGAERPDPGMMQRPPRRRTQPLIEPRLMQRAFLFLGLAEAVLCFSGFTLVYLATGQAALLGLPRMPALEALNPLRVPAADVPMLATTVFLAGVVTAQVGNAFACRSGAGIRPASSPLRNPTLLAAIGLELVLILALVYYAPLADLFGLTRLPAAYWLVLIPYAPILYGLDRLRGWLSSRIARLRGARPKEE